VFDLESKCLKSSRGLRVVVMCDSGSEMGPRLLKERAAETKKFRLVFAKGLLERSDVDVYLSTVWASYANK
jgi:hypothetical protein